MPRNSTAAIIAAMLFCSMTAKAQSAAPSIVIYRAETVATVAVSGEITAAKVRWDCAGSSCIAKAPGQLNQAEMCRDLARQVGALKSYQFGDATLDAAQVGQCNAGLQVARPLVAVAVAAQPKAPVLAGGKQTAAPVSSSPALSHAGALSRADTARFSQVSSAVAANVKSSVPNLDEYLAASRRYVESPPEQRTAAYADTVNAQFAGPIRAAIAKAVGVAPLGELLQGVQTSAGCNCAPLPEPGAPPPPAASCCSTQQFQPPFDGLFGEIQLGAQTVRPGPVSQLAPSVRSWGLAAPYRLERSGLRVTVPDNAAHVRVTVTLDTQWVIGLSGLGYAHVWLGNDMQVTGAGSAVMCSAPRLEQDNQWTWVGGYLTLSDHRPGPRITRTCEFDRTPGAATDYTVNVSAAVNGTFVGTSGGYGDYFVVLGPVDVTSCP